jgi:hypothetical protein
MFGWIPLTLALFLVLRPRTAALASSVFGFLFLPMAEYQWTGLPEYDKQMATALAVLLGVVIFDPRAFRRLRPSWIDVPMAVWCLVPFVSSYTGGLGAYDGLSACFSRLVTWGVPYVVGRIYCADREGMLLLAKFIVLAGLVYMPLCLYEVRMSPQLHGKIYGFVPTRWVQVMRYGGYRPIVFLQSPLAVGMVIAAAAVACNWLAASGAWRRLQGVPTLWLVPLLAVTVVINKMAAALTLTVIGISLFFVLRTFRRALPLVMLIALFGSYPFARLSGQLGAERLLTIAGPVYPEERVRSLTTRLRSEDLISQKAMYKWPVFGGGGWGALNVYESSGKKISIPDGLWIIAFGQNGLVGLTALALAYLLPACLILRRYPVARLTAPELAPVGALVMTSVMYWIDSLSNAMINPVFITAMGALGGFLMATRPVGARPRRVAAGGARAAPARLEPTPTRAARSR